MNYNDKVMDVIDEVKKVVIGKDCQDNGGDNRRR